jgi:hypothetical protein
MKRFKSLWVGCLAAAWLMSAGGARAAAPEIISDNFNDGVRNPALWYVSPWSITTFKETGGRLLFTRNTQTNLAWQQAGWAAKWFTRSYDQRDYMDIRVTVRVPHKILSNPPGTNQTFEVGLGFWQSLADFNYVELSVRDSLANRKFVVYYESDDLGTSHEWTYAAPTNASIFNLRIYFSAFTKKASFYWQLPGEATWHVVRPPLAINTLFHRGLPYKMRPYMVGYMDEAAVPASWNVYLDNFMAIYGDIPL